jgi:hypothetical protein
MQPRIIYPCRIHGFVCHAYKLLRRETGLSHLEEISTRRKHLSALIITDAWSSVKK